MQPYAACLIAAPCAVFEIALDMEAQRGELRADLVMAAGNKIYFHKEVMVTPAFQPVAEHGLFGG